jgi:phytoene dehydrogenase-like protein
MRALVRSWPEVESHIMGPLVRIPRHPVALGRFGVRAVLPATTVARRFDTPELSALFAGNAAHAFVPLERPLTASFGWYLMASAHTHGWPVAVGGSQAIADALASYLRSLGGVIRTDHEVQNLDELAGTPITMVDTSPETFARIARDRLPPAYLRRVGRYRRGPAAYKIDYALDGPVPWAHPDLGRAGTVHLAGTLDEVAEAERAAFEGFPHPRPFILVAQQSVFDATRAPEGKHTLWVYAHVPHASRADHSETIERRIEEFAPGFRSRVLARHVMSPQDLERWNPNMVGGDIAGGAHTVRQLVFRPFPQANPYSTPIEGVYLCSASTPPGAGTHGMCGHHAAMSALRP